MVPTSLTNSSYSTSVCLRLHWPPSSLLGQLCGTLYTEPCSSTSWQQRRRRRRRRVQQGWWWWRRTILYYVVSSLSLWVSILAEVAVVEDVAARTRWLWRRAILYYLVSCEEALKAMLPACSSHRPRHSHAHTNTRTHEHTPIHWHSNTHRHSHTNTHLVTLCLGTPCYVYVVHYFHHSLHWSHYLIVYDLIAVWRNNYMEKVWLMWTWIYYIYLYYIYKSFSVII